jgi:hypothetical protein
LTIVALDDACHLAAAPARQAIGRLSWATWLLASHSAGRRSARVLARVLARIPADVPARALARVLARIPADVRD